MESVEAFLAHAIRIEQEAALRFGQLADAMTTQGNREVGRLFRQLMLDLAGRLQTEIPKRLGADDVEAECERLSSRTKAETIERARKLIELATPAQPLRSAKPDPAPAEAEATDKPIHPCPCCGSAMIIIEMFEAGSTPRNKPTTPVARRIDTS